MSQKVQKVYRIRIECTILAVTCTAT